MTYFTPMIDKYFAYWLIHSTWHTDKDIEDNFWRFVIALNYYSRLLRDKTLTPDDPSLAHLPKRHRIRIANKRTCRNPRTYDEATLRKKILLAIERNHPGFDMDYADRLVTELCKKAMIILDALWSVKIRHFPDRAVEQMKTLQLK
jgi:hypothetical protein